MILTGQDYGKRGALRAPQTEETIDQVFKHFYEGQPDSVVFRETGDNAASITAREAERRIDGFAAFFAHLGLKNDMVIGIHLPPTADAAVAMLAALRAGLILCPLPLHWGKGEISQVVARTAMRAIITSTWHEGPSTAETIRDIAAENFSIRFVFGMGGALPDGVTDLQRVLTEIETLGPSPSLERRSPAGAHIALLSLAGDGKGGFIPIPFAHRHLLAAARAHNTASGEDGVGVLLSTMHPASLAGFGAGLLSALDAQETIAFHQPWSNRDLVRAIHAAQARRLLVPAVLGASLAALLPKTVSLSLVRTGHEPKHLIKTLPLRHASLDVLTLDGLCLLPLKREADGAPALLPRGSQRLSNQDDAFVCTLQALSPGTVGSKGELLLSGAAIPDKPWPEKERKGKTGIRFNPQGVLHTGIMVRATPEGSSLILDEAGEDVFVIAGHLFDREEIEATLQDHPDIAHVKLFAVEADLIGMRIGIAAVAKAGKTLSLDSMRAFCHERGLHTLSWPQAMKNIKEVLEPAILRDDRRTMRRFSDVA